MPVAPSSDSSPTPEDRSIITVLDLFAGAGGLSAGLESASKRFRTVTAVEMEPRAAATFQANHPGAHVHCGRIEDWLQEESVPQVDLVVGGPPCQGFSALGKQALDDERNSMWRHYAAAVAAARPRFFVMENVPQFMTSPEYALFKELVEEDGPLKEYDFTAEVVNAADYGAAQKRRRAIVIGYRKDVGDPGRPVVTHGPTTRAMYRTVRNVIGGLPPTTTLPENRIYEFEGKTFRGPFQTSELHVDRTYTQRSLDRFKKIPLGGNRFDLPEDLKCEAWKKHTTGSGDVMGRLHWDQPSVTIRTEFTKPEKGRYLHPALDRAITPREGAMLQGFTEEYLFVGSVTQIVKQIGNAVPIPLGAAIGRLLLPHWADH